MHQSTTDYLWTLFSALKEMSIQSICSHSVFLTNWCGDSLVGDSKLVTIFECCHQHISSPTSISNLTYNGHFQTKKTSPTLGFLTNIDEVDYYNISKMWKLNFRIWTSPIFGRIFHQNQRFLYSRVVSLASVPSRDKRVVSLASVHIIFNQNGTFDVLNEKI